MNWTKEKPKKPCVFVTRDKYNEDIYDYDIWIIDWVNSDDGKYLGIMNGDGEEWGDWNDFISELYFIVEELI